MRNMVGRGTKTISATPRQLESLIRLSEALAKMRHARSEVRGRPSPVRRVPREDRINPAVNAENLLRLGPRGGWSTYAPSLVEEEHDILESGLFYFFFLLLFVA